MRTVVLRLRFTTPCLGNRKDDSQGGMLCFLRDGQNRIVFLQSWWDSASAQAAKALGRHQNEVRKVRWSPIVDGTSHTYRRFYAKDKMRKHEAFRAGDEVAVKAMVPEGIPTAEFRHLLELTGEYYGISPFRYSSGSKNQENQGRDGGYGRFEVVEIREHGHSYQKESEHAGGQPGGADSAPVDAKADVPTPVAKVRRGSPEGQEQG